MAAKDEGLPVLSNLRPPHETMPTVLGFNSRMRLLGSGHGPSQAALLGLGTIPARTSDGLVNHRLRIPGHVQRMPWCASLG